MASKRLRIRCKKSIWEGFKLSSLTVFPNERYGVLLGKRHGSRSWIHDIWIPEGQQIFSSPSELACDVFTNKSWKAEAAAMADSSGLQIIGDIHSHCFKVKASEPHIQDRAPSERDWKTCPPIWILGICTVSKSPSSVWSSIHFWDAHQPAEVTFSR